MTFIITGIYAGLLGLIFVILRMIVMIERAKSGISMLHLDNMALAEKMCRFGNFIETVPVALVLLALVETNGASTALLHTVGGLLLASRVLHPFGLDGVNGKNPLRIVSGLMTVAVFAVSSVFCSVGQVWRLREIWLEKRRPFSCRSIKRVNPLAGWVKPVPLSSATQRRGS